METPHPSPTYSERSKEEDELAENIRKLESDFCDRGCTSGVPQNQGFSTPQDVLGTSHD